MIQLLILLFLCLSEQKNEEARLRICSDTSLKYTFMVAIFRGDIATEVSYVGGGTLLGAYWVLTSSKHFLPPSPDYTVVAGANSIYMLPAHGRKDDDSVQIVIAFQYYLSPVSKIGKWDMRIALLKLQKPIKESPTVSYVRWATNADFQKTQVENVCPNAVIMGYGKTGSEFEYLHCLKVQVLSDLYCKRNVLRSYEEFPDEASCFYGLRSACFGYEGGPLLCNGTQHGVLQNFLCGSELHNYPSVYTKVHMHEEFIMNVLANYSNNTNDTRMRTSAG